MICDAGGSQLPVIAEQFQDPLTPTCWRVLDLNRIGLGFPGGSNRDPIVESVSTGNEITGPLYGRLHENKEGRNDANVPADRFWRSLALCQFG